MKEAMKGKETQRLEVLRFLQSAVKNKEIELRPNPIDGNEILGVVTKQVKQRKESIEQFEKAGRQDLVDKEKFELSTETESVDAAKINAIADEKSLNVLELYSLPLDSSTGI